MENKIWLVAVILVLVGGFVYAECDEERIRLSIADLISSKFAESSVNTDNSFRAYEQFNTKQLADTVANINNVMQQGAWTALVALFGMVLLTMSIWELIRLKKEKNILMTMLNEMRDGRKSQDTFTASFSEFAKKYTALPQQEQTPSSPVQAPVQVQDVPVPILPQKKRGGLFGMFRKKEKVRAQEPAQVHAPVPAQVPVPQQALYPQYTQQDVERVMQQQMYAQHVAEQQQKAYADYQAQVAQQHIYAEMKRRYEQKMQEEQEILRMTQELEQKKRALAQTGDAHGMAQAPVQPAQAGRAGIPHSRN